MPADSIFQLADSLVKKTRSLVRSTKTEEDLKIGFEKLLEPLQVSLGIKTAPRYEKSIYRVGYSDVVHGQLIIEYERPEAFKSKKWIDHAYNQLIDYIKGEAQSKKESLFLFSPKFVGVGFDGEQIFFVQYRGDKNTPKVDFDRQDFLLLGPYPFNQQSARTFLTYLRALSRTLLTADNLAEAFGPRSEIAPKIVSAFANSLEYFGNKKTKVFFHEWKRLFGIVYGEHFTAQQRKEEAEIMSKLYQVGRETDFQELLFSVHTYFALLMKFITAELLTLKETSFASAFSHQFVHCSNEELKNRLIQIENGGIYSKRGITNFLEGDFFRWYLQALSPELSDGIRDMTRALSEFEPATTTIDPESTRDLLKKLYQYLVPQQIRHNLGEYYTPDWLAELVLNEVGYDGVLHQRVLDPACGSGTFLVLAIQRLRQHASHRCSPQELAEKIISNVWGFDLNPLAVIASRTNYLFTLSDLVEYLPNLEIPVYLADSVLWPERTGTMQFNFVGGEHITVSTSVGEFQVPAIWIKNKAHLMGKASEGTSEIGA